jgi:hypothetical protein
MALPVSELLAVLTTTFKHGITLRTSIVVTTNSDNTAIISPTTSSHSKIPELPHLEQLNHHRHHHPVHLVNLVRTYIY